MKIEKLRNKKSYRWFLCGLILVVVLTISYRVSKANYRISNSIELTTGKVISSPYDFNIVSMYIDGVEQSKDTIIPDASLYELDEENSYCCKTTSCKKENKDSNVTLKTKGGSHTFSGISKGSRCNLAFTKIEARTMKELLDNYYIHKLERTAKNKDFNVPFGDDTKQTVYIAPDDDGLSYYFAGNPLDNWVEFGGYYWRIIRVNGDGSIRMIYQGRTKDENDNKLEPQATGEETVIGTSAFNEKENGASYAGFMYGTPGSSTYDEMHANINDSTIKIALDNWFNNSNLKQEKYFNKIDLNVGFCGDRQVSTSGTEINGLIGTDSNITYFGAFIRLRPGNEHVSLNTMTVRPTFSCVKNEDLYTYKDTNRGNKALKNPVGLINVDEVSYAGMVASYGDTGVETTTNYLYTNQSYWTMSPIWYYEGNTSAVFFVASIGSIYSHNNNVGCNYGIRPVINLRSDVKLSGSGTQLSPYKVID